MDFKNLYYLVDGHKIVSKNQALVLAQGDSNKIWFYQDDQYWDTQNWLIEPSQSFDELCRRRCHQLRDQYDWVCLWISAGYDSQTILQSFIDSNIVVDELAYYYRLDYYNDPEIPYIESTIQQYQQYHNPRVKINKVVIDSKYTLDVYRKMGQDSQFHRGQNRKLSKSTATFVHHYNDNLLSHKDTTPVSRVDIYGMEKPRLDLRDGWWYATSHDKMWQEVMDSPIEYFYISNQLPELHIKQCHMAATWFETLIDISHELVHQIQGNDALYYRDWNLGCGRKDVLCPSSRNGQVKRDFALELASPDGKKLYDYIKQHDTTIFNMLVDQEHQLGSVINNNFTPTIFGKSWALRPFKQKF